MIREFIRLPFLMLLNNPWQKKHMATFIMHSLGQIWRRKKLLAVISLHAQRLTYIFFRSPLSDSTDLFALCFWPKFCESQTLYGGSVFIWNMCEKVSLFVEAYLSSFFISSHKPASFLNCPLRSNFIPSRAPLFKASLLILRFFTECIFWFWQLIFMVAFWDFDLRGVAPIKRYFTEQLIRYLGTLLFSSKRSNPWSHYVDVSTPEKDRSNKRFILLHAV